MDRTKSPSFDFLGKIEKGVIRAMFSYAHADNETVLIEIDFIQQYADRVKELVLAQIEKNP